MNHNSIKWLILLPLRAELLFTLQYEIPCTRIDKSGPGYDEQLEHPPTQINSSSPWLDRLQTAPMILILYLPGLNTFTRTRTSSEKHWDPCFLISKHSILCKASVMMSFMYNWPGSLWFSLHCLDKNWIYVVHKVSGIAVSFFRLLKFKTYFHFSVMDIKGNSNCP